jgi:monomeric sarcosine oxidase
MQKFDVIVLGAGAMGSASAYYLSQRGKKVLLLEQFDLDHKKGSSIDHSRIIRYSYSNPIYIELMKSAYPLWRELEAQSGASLMVQTGGIDIGTPDEPTFSDTLHSLTVQNIPHELLSPQEAQKRFPQFVFTDDMQVIYQADSGILSATRCVLTHVKLAQQNGAIVKANTPVTKIVPHENHIEIHADDVYHAEKLVITAGAWMNHMLKFLDIQLPLEPLGAQVAYFAPQNLQKYSHTDMPIFITHLRKTYGDWVYGIPSINDSGLKVAFHGGQRVNDVAHINYEPTDETIEGIRRYIRRYMPEADAPLLFTRICLYTMTPDEDFVLDVHPNHPNIIIGSICSGHGFKFSTLMGSIIADLAIDNKTSHNLSLFPIGRFL